MIESLSPFENILYAAQLRQDGKTDAEIRERAESLIRELRLTQCRDTPVGTAGLVRWASALNIMSIFPSLPVSLCHSLVHTPCSTTDHCVPLFLRGVSGGERKRTNIALSLVNDKVRLLLADGEAMNVALHVNSIRSIHLKTFTTTSVRCLLAALPVVSILISCPLCLLFPSFPAPLLSFLLLLFPPHTPSLSMFTTPPQSPPLA